jgi:RNA polymerase sigma-70 factor (ECF subfamily)
MMRHVLVRAPDAPEVARAAIESAPEPTTLEGVFARYSKYVFQLAYRMVGRRADAEDIAQDVFSLVIVKLDAVLASRSVRLWLASATVKTSLHVLRHRRLRQRLGLENDVDYEQACQGVTSSEELDRVTRLLTALARLSPVERAAWVLRHVEGETQEDLAKALDCSVSTAKRRVADAERKIKELLGND